MAEDVFAEPKIIMQRAGDALLLSSAEPLAEPDTTLAAVLSRWASETPDAVLAAEWAQDARRWRELTYGAARTAADAIGAGLLDIGLNAHRPLVILSRNSIDHLLLTLACYTIGVPVVPVSTAHSLLSSDHGRLREIVRLVHPGAIYAEDGAAYRPALDALRDAAATVLTSVNPPATMASAPLAELRRTPAIGRIEQAAAGVGPDTVAKILFTSGSTGAPKGVPNTHRMLCANQQMMCQVWPLLRSITPTLVDWLPWSHTFGGNHNLHLVLTGGGALYIDDGGPRPELFARSLRNLGNAQPNLYFNVPAGFAMLADAVEADEALAKHLFQDLRIMLSAAAALAEPLRRRLLAVARDVGREVRFTTSWGLTETAPAATSAHFATDEPGAIGVPLPGVSLKLAPVDGRLELRVKGPTVFAGYHERPDLTAAAFDEDGYLRTGDAAKLVDPGDPGAGLVFDGRIAEDFKLVTGTWVRVTQLRAALLTAAAGVLAEVVLVGEGRDAVTALGWLAPGPAGPDPGGHGARDAIAGALAELNRGAGSSLRVERLLLVDQPLSRDAGELSDKGSVNRRRVIERHPSEVAMLYADPVPADVILPAGQ